MLVLKPGMELNEMEEEGGGGGCRVENSTVSNCNHNQLFVSSFCSLQKCATKLSKQENKLWKTII